jgi:hypothetical protein
MRTPTKVAGFAVGLLAVFGAAAGIGALVGPVAGSETAAAESHTADHTSTSANQPELPGGLMVSQDGYTLDLEPRRLTPSASARIDFRILGPDGRPVTRYTRKHGKDLHLIAVRGDLTGFQHVHPRLAPNGTWTVPLTLSRAGGYRVFADFTPAGRSEGLTLGADLSVAGRFDPQPLPVASPTAHVDDYTVTLDGGLVAGQESKLTLTVSRNGRPVTDLQPYLEAYGHLVALRDRDLAYLHVHPAGSPGDGVTASGPRITFYATAPSAGAYRLFLDFRHGDRVRTAEFTVSATGGAQAQPDPDSSAGAGDGHAEEPGGSDHGHEAGEQQTGEQQAGEKR